MIVRTTLTTLVVGLAACLSSPQAVAGSLASNAVDSCNGALPGFEGALRKRPLGIANEGAASAFVTCSFTNAYNLSGILDGLVFVTNRRATSVDITCTFVNGLVAEAQQVNPDLPLPTYFVKTVALEAGEFAPVAVFASDYELDAFALPYMNVNCALPSGVEMNLVGYDYSEPA